MKEKEILKKHSRNVSNTTDYDQSLFKYARATLVGCFFVNTISPFEYAWEGGFCNSHNPQHWTRHALEYLEVKDLATYNSIVRKINKTKESLFTEQGVTEVNLSIRNQVLISEYLYKYFSIDQKIKLSLLIQKELILCAVFNMKKFIEGKVILETYKQKNRPQ